MSKEFLPKYHEQFILPPSVLCKEFLKLQFLGNYNSWKFRILEPPIAGWIIKENEKLIRVPVSTKKPENCLHPFWAFYVWHYTDACLHILYVIEASVIDQIITLSKEKGDLTQYDIQITRNKYTGYHVMCYPEKTEINEEISKALKLHPVCLEMIYDENKEKLGNKDPWEFMKEALAILT